MDRRKKIYFGICLILLMLGLGAGIKGGWELHKKLAEPKIVEKPILVPIELNDPQLIETAIQDASEKYGIRKEVFEAIIKCEGGTVFGWNKTSDGGLFQINWQTAKQYGAQSLKDLIDPRYSAELAAKILLKEGLKAWRTRDCIENELIKITK
jgi:hypothetical protein